MERMIRLAYTILVLAMISGCNQNDHDSVYKQQSLPVVVSVNPAPKPIIVTVQPSLGQVLNGVVTLLNTHGVVIQNAKVNNLGQSVFTVPEQLAAPFIVRVCGGEGVSYFDEALEKNVPLPKDFCLRAIVTERQTTTLAISALSESVVRYFEENEGLTAMTAVAVKSRYADFANKLAISPNMAVLPTQINGVDKLKQLIGRVTGASTQKVQTTEADQYAYRLATLAVSARVLAQHRGFNLSAPALVVTDAIASDLVDTLLDGKNKQVYIVAPFYDGLQLNALFAFVQGSYLKAYLGDAFIEQNLTTVEGQQYLKSHDWALPPVLPVVRSAPDDSLLSWQGRYVGVWHLKEGVDLGKQFSFLLPSVYQSFMSHLVEGSPCQIDATDEFIIIDGLPFTIDPTVKVVANTFGQREYLLQRNDTGLTAVSASGSLKTENSLVKQLDFSIKVTSGLLPRGVNAALSCQVANM